MSRYEWLLLIHMIGAFAAIGAVVVLTVVVLAARTTADTAAAALRLSPLGRNLWNFGGALTLIFGVWLAIDVDGYSLTDGWILGALVAWAVAGGAGAQIGVALGNRGDAAPDPGRVVVLWAVMTIGVALLFGLMIFKPGA